MVPLVHSVQWDPQDPMEQPDNLDPKVLPAYPARMDVTVSQAFLDPPVLRVFLE